MIIKAVRRVFN